VARASAPLPAAVTLAVAVVVGAAVAGTLVGLPVDRRAPPTVAMSLSAEGDRLALSHRAGAPLRTTDLRVRVVVDGTPLAHQPPVPFFAARGFRSGPTGPFNPASDPEWSPGETATLRVAGTNRPGIDPGDRVAVVLSVDDRRVARLTATATPADPQAVGGPSVASSPVPPRRRSSASPPHPSAGPPPPVTPRGPWLAS
jgi:hypothetical protein